MRQVLPNESRQKAPLKAKTRSAQIVFQAKCGNWLTRTTSRSNSSSLSTPRSVTSTTAISSNRTVLPPWPSGVSWRPERPQTNTLRRPAQVCLTMPGSVMRRAVEAPMVSHSAKSLAYCRVASTPQALALIDGVRAGPLRAAASTYALPCTGWLSSAQRRACSRHSLGSPGALQAVR